MELRKLWLAIMVMGVMSSAALAGGPFGPPMSMLDEGQWALDAAYFQEEMDLWGCTTGSERFFTNVGEPNDPNFVESEDSPDYFDDRIHLVDFETTSILGSIEYGLCENWDLLVRLGVTKAEATIEDTDDKLVFGETGPPEEVVYKDKINLDFGYGFAWQIGTAFTICQTGSVTWGGRMQFGMADPDDDSVSRTQVEAEFFDGSKFIEQSTIDADIDFWQAVAYFGPTWQASDAWALYCGGGWQVLQGTWEASGSGTGKLVDADGNVSISDRFTFKEEGKLKHASALVVLGGAWTPSESVGVGAEFLIGEGGKWGWGVSGVFPF